MHFNKLKKGADISMYKKSYFMLFNRISDIIEYIEKTIDSIEDERVKEAFMEILSYMIKSQCEAEEIIIGSKDEI